MSKKKNRTVSKNPTETKNEMNQNGSESVEETKPEETPSVNEATKTVADEPVESDEIDFDIPAFVNNEAEKNDEESPTSDDESEEPSEEDVPAEKPADHSIRNIGIVAAILVVIAVIFGMRSCRVQYLDDNKAETTPTTEATETPVAKAVTHTVTYVTDEGTITEAFEEGVSYELLALEDDEFKTFKGWNYSGDKTTPFMTLDSSVDSDVVLEPVYEAKSYNIRYELYGGLLEKQQATYTAGTAVEVGTPYKDGCDFYGWYYDATFTQPFTGITAETTGDVTLYASWSTSIYDDCADIANQIKNAYGVDVNYNASKAVYAKLQDVYGQLNAYSSNTLSGVSISIVDGNGYGLSGNTISLGIDNGDFNRDLHAMMFRKIDGNNSSAFDYEFGLYPTYINDEAKSSNQRDAEMVWGYALTTGVGNNSDIQMKWSVLYGLYGTALK